MLLPDNAYFDLMRSVFGNIKTPFNKQRLLEDLGTFLSRREIQEIIAAYIDEEDARVIAAAAILDEPAPGELESFFTGELSYAELYAILLNLEERLILYRFEEDGVRRIALNPLLEPVLAPVIADTGALFPSAPAIPGTGLPADETSPPGPGSGAALFDDRLFAALFAFTGGAGDFFKAEGGIRKKVLDEGAAVFPGLKLDVHIGALQCLGLLKLEGERLSPDEGKLVFFNDLTVSGRLEYYAAGMGVYLMYTGTAANYFHRGQIQFLARLIHELIHSMEDGRRYSVITLRRMAEVLSRKEPEAGIKDGPDKALVFKSMMAALEQTGLLRPAGSSWWIKPPPVPPSLAPVTPAAMDTAFSCILYPEIAFEDAVALAFFCSVRGTGAVVRFEITRESAVRGFNRGMDAAAMLELLNRLIRDRVDQNLEWTLRDWENRYSGVVLQEGVVLTLSPERRYLAETMAPLIARILAPGVYLLAADRFEAVQELERAGVDIIAQPPLRRRDDPAEGRRSPYPPPASLPRGFTIPRGGRAHKPDSAGMERNKERFRKALETMQLSKNEREELSARIERRLILNESQLSGASLRYEKLEARGLDYVGKTAIAKQAAASKLQVEAFWPGPDGKTLRVLGIPQGLEKLEGETILVINPVPGGESIRLPLGKISLLRRMKKSIFGE
jgi:hypothetical protein